MAHVNTKLLRDTYQAFAGGDLEPLLGALTDDISWHDSTLGPLAGHYTGKDQVPNGCSARPLTCPRCA